ncbi:MAG TPA: hypothetical protein VF131_02095 [Blastocatellia bacterium]|nr:hypothetical protein [Blastocatellia bacterium]
MKFEGDQKLIRFLLTIICITAYLFFFIAVLADTFNTNLYDFVVG